MSNITTPNLHRINENDMSYKQANSDMMKDVMECFMTGSSVGDTRITGELRKLAEDAILTGSTSWGEANSWYTSGKFLSSYNESPSFITVDPERWLQLHDSINHGRDGAKQSTVDWIQEQVQEDDISEIPTPTLALEPDEYGKNPIVYKPTREGRSRGVGAKRAGLDRMPVLVSVRRPTK
jgi:hypothetical protein